MSLPGICNVTRLHKVGAGGHSEVFKAFDNNRDEIVALKVVSDTGSELSRAFWQKEVESLSRLNHPNIVKILDAIKIGDDDSNSEFLIELEWLEETLSERYARNAYSFNPTSWIKISTGLIDGISHAHQLNIAHRDIKPENLLFKSKQVDDFSVIIADFGISKNFDPEYEGVTVSDFGSKLFTPPDHASRDPFSRDVYSVAAVLVQLCSNVLLRDTLDLQQTLKNASLPPEITSLLRDSLDINPSNRPVNMVEFKSRFDEINTKYKKQLQKQAPALSLNVKFTNSARMQLLEGAPEDISKAINKFNSLNNSEELFAQLIKPDARHDDQSLRVSLCSDDWVLTLKAHKEPGQPGYLLLLHADKPDFDNLERYKHGAKSITGAYKFIALEQREKVNPSFGLESLLSELKRFNSSPKVKIEDLSTFDTWGRILDAREELIRGTLRPLEFIDVHSDANATVFTLKDVPEFSLFDTSWEIAEVKGCFFEIIHANEVTVTAKASRFVELSKLRGKLLPSLGKDSISLARQRTALLEFKNGDISSTELKAAIERPDEALAINITPSIVPIIGDLDEDKMSSVHSALSTQDVFVVQGPPGTGKTSFIAELVHQIKKSNPVAKILLVAQTHVAVDNAILRLENSNFTDILRIGESRDERIHSGVHKYLVDQQLKVWIENIRLDGEASLSERAGIKPDSLAQLKALSILSQLNALRKQRQYLEQKAYSDTSAFELSISETQLDNLDEALSNAEIAELGLREKLRKISAQIADKELNYNDNELDSWVTDFISKFPRPEQLMKLLEVQASWFSKIATDVDLRYRYLSSAGLVAGTCIGFLKEKAVRDMAFDYCIIDEASKATATETLVPMSTANRVVLVGDSNQLPPNDEELLGNSDILLNHSLSRADIEVTLFDKLRNSLPPSKSKTLTTQWRMSKAIGDLISHCFYDGKLVSVNTDVIPGYSNLIGSQVRWLDTSLCSDRTEIESRGGGYSNPLEAKIIANEISRISKFVLGRHLKVNSSNFEILVVSPYRAQKRAIEEELRMRDFGDISVRIETADAVQGSEADIVFVATTRSNSEGRLGFLGSLQWRRINVALSRAKFGLIIVGDAKFVAGTQGGLTLALNYIKSNTETCELEQVQPNA